MLFTLICRSLHQLSQVDLASASERSAGEKVAFGILCLLVLENRPPAEFAEAARFCHDIGLPTRLADLA